MINHLVLPVFVLLLAVTLVDVWSRDVSSLQGCLTGQTPTVHKATKFNVLLAASAAPTPAFSVRGVQKAEQLKYRSSSSTFSCISPYTNESIDIPLSAINDDFCDCRDGEDEPATSACAHTSVRYYCANKGSKPLLLSTLYVNDHICDCCDGTDERPGECPNTCHVQGEAERQSLKKDIADMQAGLQQRTEIIAANQAERQQEIEKLASFEPKLADRKRILEEARAKKEHEEEVERAEREKREAEAKRIADEEAARNAPPADDTTAPSDGEIETTDRTTIAVDVPVYDDTINDAVTQTVELTAHYTDADTESVPAAEEEPVEQAFPYPKEYQAPPTEAADEAETAEQNFPYPAEYAAPPSDTAADEELPGPDDSEDATPQALPKVNLPGSKFDPKPAAPAAYTTEVVRHLRQSPWGIAMLNTGDTIQRYAEKLWRKLRPTEAEAAREAFNKAQTKVTKMENKIAELQRKHAKTYGADLEFAKLDGQCFEFKQQKYTYEMCPYKNAAQKEGASHTSLGNWEGLGTVNQTDRYGNEIQRQQFKFTNGQGCWQGPARSLTVDLYCAAESTILTVDEASKCVYHMTFTTPAVCSQHELQLLERKLHQAEHGEDLEEE